MRFIALAVSAVLVAGAFFISEAAAEAAADARAHDAQSSPHAPQRG